MNRKKTVIPKWHRRRNIDVTVAVAPDKSANRWNAFLAIVNVILLCLTFYSNWISSASLKHMISKDRADYIRENQRDLNDSANDAYARVIADSNVGILRSSLQAQLDQFHIVDEPQVVFDGIDQMVFTRQGSWGFTYRLMNMGNSPANVHINCCAFRIVPDTGVARFLANPWAFDHSVYCNERTINIPPNFSKVLDGKFGNLDAETFDDLASGKCEVYLLGSLTFKDRAGNAFPYTFLIKSNLRRINWDTLVNYSYDHLKVEPYHAEKALDLPKQYL